jgi:hypothetical protein
MTRYSARTLIGQPTLANWGKAAAGGIGVVDGYGVATGGASTSPTVDGQAYTLLTFTSDDNLVVSADGLFDVLLFGGGGSGGSCRSNSASGGGGAGQALETTIFLSAGTYAIDIGSGGAGGYDTSSVGLNTSITTDARSIAAVGGGGGAAYFKCCGLSGGSGGGGGSVADPTPSTLFITGGKTVCTVGGNNGGNGRNGNNDGAGGGGGATGAGANGVSATVGGAGGAGYDTDAFTDAGSLFKAGGGGGGSGTTGGAGGSSVGGAGGSGVGGASASANTASGGGGSGFTTHGGNGGSGIAYIRFKV